MKYLQFFISAIIVFSLHSCKKDSFNQSADAIISFSADTLFFDTVFTATGSVTQSFKILNPNNQRIKLTSVRLAGGEESPFKINISGVSATELRDKVIQADDSMYVFVQVMVNPNDFTQSFILEDSIAVRYNGNTRWVQLRAYGQNAIFLRNHQVSSDTTWNNYLPIVIYGSLKVNPGVTLKITEGSRVFVHATAPVIIDGTLDVAGSPSYPVVFSGNRTDAEYRDLPAGWPGIYFSTSSKDNRLQNTVIKNAYQGLVVEQMPDNTNPKLTLSRCVIENIYDAGILALHSSIEADNTLIANCGSNLMFVLGGEYSFTNCTIVTYGSYYINHKNPVVQIADYFEQSDMVYTADLDARFVNSIIWGDNGSVENEIVLSQKGSGPFNVVFDHCIYKAKNPIPAATFASSLLNTPPEFDSINTARNIYDFRFRNRPESPAIKAGRGVSFMYDLEGNPRVNPPDIGCYERP